MKKELFIFLMFTSAITHCNSTVLAATGYWAASPPMRNYIIESGAGNIITQGARSLYDISGYRYISDPGLMIRKAKMKDRTIAETKLRKRKGLAAIRETENKDRNYSERLFNVLSEMDKKVCVPRLLCEIGAEPSKFGIIGLKVHNYIQSIPPVTWNSLTFSYKEAFIAGLDGGYKLCLKLYSDCHYDLHRAVSFLWLILNPLGI